MRALLLVFASIFLTASAHADQNPRWGKVICEAVSAADAEAFAQANHFLDNWDYNHVANPPYVAAKGTIACSAPVKYTSDYDSDGHTFYRLEVNYLDAPFHAKPCAVTYYGSGKVRHFEANAAGDGYVNLVPGSNDFDLSFIDNDQSKYQDDSFLAVQIGQAPQITWMGEIRDDEAHAPIVSNCHIEL